MRSPCICHALRGVGVFGADDRLYLDTRSGDAQDDGVDGGDVIENRCEFTPARFQFLVRHGKTCQIGHVADLFDADLGYRVSGG